MKKKKIDDLFLNKKVVSELGREIIGGKMPESDPATYRCQTAGPPCGGPDPLPIATCGCASPTLNGSDEIPCFEDTFSMCGTRPGRDC